MSHNALTAAIVAAFLAAGVTLEIQSQLAPPPLLRAGIVPHVRICTQVYVFPECMDLASDRCQPRTEWRCK